MLGVKYDWKKEYEGKYKKESIKREKGHVEKE